MKNINILSLTQAHNSLQDDSFESFLNYYGIKIKNEEIDDLTSLVSILYPQTNNKNIFNQFYVGYLIPQIGKEFDLLRFGKNCIINLELKKTSTKEIIQKQLKRNKYYLGFIGKVTHHFCYQSDTKELFYLSDNDVLESADYLCLIKLLEDQKINNISNIDNLFNPSDYLVSPFNSTEKFIKDEYFLTKQQETVKSEILKTIEDKTTANFISITGSAGTGKTLLTYDIAKQINRNNKKALIIHCGLLNIGQLTLNNEPGWNITPIKHYSRHELSDYDVIIVDEAQRIYPNQLNAIVDKIQSVSRTCIFSYDKLQTLAKAEERNNIDQHINSISSIVPYKLTEKIRTNKEIALFMKALFFSKRGIKLSNKDNIELNYFENIDDAKDYLGTLDNQEWEILHFTPSQYNKEHHEKYSDSSHKTSHRIIGQEFENVVITVDNFFSYDENGELIYKGSTYYDAAKMLFQNITRTRKRLNLVIINNSELLDRCVSVLQN
jgi:Cdc6-like AAA superfamily ATPase